MSELHTQFAQAFPLLLFEAEAALAQYTAIKIGGPAEVLVSVNTTPDLIALVQYCREQKIAVTILGWGANTLIADRGIRGLVIRNMTREMTITRESPATQTTTPIVIPRHQAISDKVDFSSLDYSESANTPTVTVTLASGWPLPSLISTLLTEGITGLQWYSRIPATLGGAIVNNVHGGTHFLSERIVSIQVLTNTNEILDLAPDQCEFGYDYSRFHHSDEIILAATLRLWLGDAERARHTIGEWAKRKSVQPQKSLGCVFQNLTSEEQTALKLPTPSIGYIIDQILHLKGKRIGDAQISNTHAAFIENVGQATAQNYLDLTLEIYRAFKARFNISLRPEIFFRGFDPTDLEELVDNNSL